MDFKNWLKTQDGFTENMWGNIPCKTRKPSDGWKGKPGGGAGMGMGAMQQGQMQPQMMRKMKKK